MIALIIFLLKRIFLSFHKLLTFYEHLKPLILPAFKLVTFLDFFESFRNYNYLNIFYIIRKGEKI